MASDNDSHLYFTHLLGALEKWRQFAVFWPRPQPSAYTTDIQWLWSRILQPEGLRGVCTEIDLFFIYMVRFEVSSKHMEEIKKTEGKNDEK